MTTKLTLHGELIEHESLGTPLLPEVAERLRIADFFRRHRAATGECKVISTNVTSKGKHVAILMELASGNVVLEEARFLSLIDCVDLSLRP